MNIDEVRTLLDTQLATVTNLPAHQAENTRFEKKTGTPWVRSTLIPTETVSRTTASDELTGLYQVDVFYPQGKGAATAGAMAQAIKDAFARGSSFGEGEFRLHVMKSWREASQDFEQFYQIPVLVRWSAIVPKE